MCRALICKRHAFGRRLSNQAGIVGILQLQHPRVPRETLVFLPCLNLCGIIETCRVAPSFLADPYLGLSYYFSVHSWYVMEF